MNRVFPPRGMELALIGLPVVEKNLGRVKVHDSIQFHNLIWFLLVGGLAGWLASVFVTGGGMGLFGDIVVGVAGAIVGGLLADSLNWNIYGFWGVLGISVLGAMILIVLFRGIAGARQKV
jgi:uncharacterized membrane protein YeaQ/YmgE (transglycosylase-associated protein family)